MEEGRAKSQAAWEDFRDQERKYKERKITQRVATGEHGGDPYSQELRDRVADSMYAVMPNRFTIDEAFRYIDHGLEVANNKFFNEKNDLHPAIRNYLGIALLRIYNEMGDYEAAQEVNMRLAEYGTMGGQGIQVLRYLAEGLDTPEKAQAFFAKNLARARDGTLQQKDVQEARKMAEEVQALANEMFVEWIDDIVGVKPDPTVSPDINTFPDMTFNLTADKLNQLSKPVADMIEAHGAAATDQALLDKYGEAVRPHLPEIKKAAMKRILARRGDDTLKVDQASKKIKRKVKKTALEMLRARGIKTPKQTVEAIEKIIDLFDRGEISMEDIDTIFAEKYNIPEAPPEVMEKLAEMSKRIARLPEGSDTRRNAVVDLLDYVHDYFQGIDFVDIGWALWYANILSGYNTHLRNLGDTGLQVFADTFFSVLHWNPAKMASRAYYAIQGFWAGMKFGWKEAKRHVVTGQAMIGRDTVSKFGSRGALERIRARLKVFKPYVWAKVIPRLLIAEDGFWFHTALEARSRIIALDIADTKNLSDAEKMNAISEILHLSDQQLADYQEQAEMEWDNLLPGDVADAKWGGIWWKDMTHDEMREAWIDRRVEELKRQNRDGLLQERASSFAQRATYNYTPEGTLGVAAEFLGAGLHGIQNSAILERALKDGNKTQKAMALAVKAASGIGTPLMPFTRIVANVMNKWLDYTPLGIVRGTVFRNYKWVKEAGAKVVQHKELDQATEELKKGVFGTLAMYALLNILKPDEDEDPMGLMIHGEGHRDWGKNKQLMGTDWIPFSVSYKGRYFSYRNTPIAFALSWVGNIHDTYRYRRDELENTDYLTKMAYSLASAGRLLLSQSFVVGLADFMDIMGRSEESMLRGLDRFAKRTLDPTAVAVPFNNAFRQVNAALDENLRDRPGIIATMMSSIPVVSTWNQPALDMLGQPIDSRPMSWLFSLPRDHHDRRIWVMIAEKQAFIGRIWQYKNKMTQGQWYEFQRIRGNMVRDLILEDGQSLLIEMEQESPEIAQKIMQRISTRATRMAREAVGYVEPE
jgi:hypothetical protein